jgi:hypothetical protein
MGGIVIRYTATIFVEPKPLTESEYMQIRDFLRDNPYKQIFRQENTDGMYNNYYWTMGVAAGILLLYAIVKYFFGELLLMDWIALVAGITFFGSMYKLYLESSSYSAYEKNRDAYFLRMKFAIMTSLNFSEFNKYFYTIFSRHFDSDYAIWKKRYFKKQL